MEYIEQQCWLKDAVLKWRCRCTGRQLLHPHLMRQHHSQWKGHFYVTIFAHTIWNSLMNNFVNGKDTEHGSENKKNFSCSEINLTAQI